MFCLCSDTYASNVSILIDRSLGLSKGSLTTVTHGVESSVAEQDPHPGKNRFRIRILYPQEDPCNLNFLVIINCFKYSFVKKIILSVIRCLDLVRKCQKKNIYFAQHQKHI